MDYTRREFLGTASATAALALALNTSTAKAAHKMLKGERVLCFVGGYTKGGTEGVTGNGEGISTFEMNQATGKLEFLRSYKDIISPSYIVISADQKFLYALSEVNNYDKGHSGSVSAFAIDQKTGELTKLNTVSSKGGSPCHLSLHPTGKYIFVANYVGGSVAVLPIYENGKLGEATDVVKNKGPKMPETASDNPVGNFAISNHAGSHLHMVMPDPKGNYVFADDAGLDRMYVWKFDVKTGKLTPAPIPFYQLPPGSAPRHFVFNRKQTIVYNLCEQNSKIVVSRFNQETGKMSPVQNISVVNPNFKGSNLSAELLLSENGKQLYVSNRLADSIAIFDVQPNGTLKSKGEVWAHADYGRAMAFDPTENFLFVANQHSDSVTSFRINHTTGGLSFTNHFTPVGSPTTLGFIVLGKG